MKYLSVILIFLTISIPFIYSSVSGPDLKSGDDWSVPGWATITTNSGFFSEETSTSSNINVGVFDVAWRQLNPSKDVYTYTATATVKDMAFQSFNTQNSTTKSFWMRIWNSGVDWAPTWIQSYCSVGSIGKDYDGDSHLPIWNSCVWGEIKKMYSHIFLDLNMRADPRLKFIYVPGAFNWCEFDLTEVGNYSTVTGYSYTSFNTWFQQAMQDLVDIFGPYSYKLVYTGEDYPFDVDNWPATKNLLARDAVSKGMGIRNGITEIFNFHLSQIPAYGVTIDTTTGYLNFNKSWPLQSNPNRVIGTENECYNDCGFTVASANIYYAVKMSNIKALQMGVNWLYLVPSTSYISTYSDFYNWIRYSLGKQSNTAFDAWATLRNAQDTFWSSDNSLNWPGKPYIKNLETNLLQRDIKGGAYTKNGSTKKTNIYGGNNDLGISYEGRQTDIASGNNTMSFFLDDQFSFGTIKNVQIKVTYLDLQPSQWLIRYKDNDIVLNTTAVTVGTTNIYYTATFNFTSIQFNNSITIGRNADFEIINTGSKDIEILFVRVVKSFSVSPGTTTGSIHNSDSGANTIEPNETSILSISFNLLLLLSLILSLI
ncbi:hypothetical protein RB653_007880 [Dictyostelium firmibasis]|uniref:Uncharacterized protein n=1 Tax=Dictyostelium firmibasis TaxID=79012 RepID=A0AAN7YPF1_9MYCE